MDNEQGRRMRPYYEEIEKEKKRMRYDRKLVDCCRRIDEAYMSIGISEDLLERKGKLEAQLALRGFFRYLRLLFNPAKVVFNEYCAEYELKKIEQVLEYVIQQKQLPGPDTSEGDS